MPTVSCSSTRHGSELRPPVSRSRQGHIQPCVVLHACLAAMLFPAVHAESTAKPAMPARSTSTSTTTTRCRQLVRSDSTDSGLPPTFLAASSLRTTPTGLQGHCGPHLDTVPTVGAQRQHWQWAAVRVLGGLVRLDKHGPAALRLDNGRRAVAQLQVEANLQRAGQRLNSDGVDLRSQELESSRSNLHGQQVNLKLYTA